MLERWRPSVDGYWVSDWGRFYRLPRVHDGNDAGFSGKRVLKGRLLKGTVTKNGYRVVYVAKNKNNYVHRLVAGAFIPNPKNLEWVNHKDGNKLNNHVLNLEWSTPAHNNRHAIACGLRPSAKPVRCIDTGEEFPSVSQAAKSRGVGSSALKVALNRGICVWRGCRWEYLRPEERAA